MAVLANVTQEILKAAEEEVSKIKADAKAEADRILSDAASKVAELEQNEAKKRDEEVERLKRQEISSAELESKKIVLAKKKEILSNVFDETLKELEDADPKDKLKHYVKMVAYAKTIIPEPIVIMSKDDKFTAKQLEVAEVKRDAKIKGGLIIQSEDGQIEIDMQYSALLRTVWDRGIKDVSDILFG